MVENPIIVRAPSEAPATIVAFATKGTDTNEEHRLRQLLSGHSAMFLNYDKGAKVRSFRSLLRVIFKTRPRLLVMEGTGLAGGAICLLSRVLVGQRYVVSSGDAIGPFVGAIVPPLGPFFGLYERLLCRLSAGFIGWTPYLTGRALTFGAPRAMTAAGWSEHRPSAGARERIRSKLCIPPHAIVFGLVGSLVWNPRLGYCYGSELVRAAVTLDRSDVYVLVVGDGSGLRRLQDLAGDRLGRTVLLPGPVPADEVIDYMAAMDVGSLPQSVDRVGSFRYTTKISEYFSAGLPSVTGQIPLSYDLDDGWLWRLPGSSPWSKTYIAALTNLMNTISAAELAGRRALVPGVSAIFEVNRQVRAVTSFVSDLLDGDSVGNGTCSV